MLGLAWLDLNWLLINRGRDRDRERERARKSFGCFPLPSDRLLWLWSRSKYECRNAAQHQIIAAFC